MRLDRYKMLRVGGRVSPVGAVRVYDIHTGGAIGFRNDCMDLENIKEHRVYEQKCRLCILPLQWYRSWKVGTVLAEYEWLCKGNTTCLFTFKFGRQSDNNGYGV